MVYIMSLLKAAALAAELHVGSPCLCPAQAGDSRADEEYDCEVVALVAGPNTWDGVVIVREVAP